MEYSPNYCLRPLSAIRGHQLRRLHATFHQRLLWSAVAMRVGRVALPLWLRPEHPAGQVSMPLERISQRNGLRGKPKRRRNSSPTPGDPATALRSDLAVGWFVRAISDQSLQKDGFESSFASNWGSVT